jgi:hypothetical protein
MSQNPCHASETGPNSDGWKQLREMMKTYHRDLDKVDVEFERFETTSPTSVANIIPSTTTG